MNYLEAMKVRHSVRAYKDQPIEQQAVEALDELVYAINENVKGLRVQLVTNEPKAFQSAMAKYGKFKGCSNYFVLAIDTKAGKKEALEELVGYYGETLVLESQILGLNTCWVGLTYGKIGGAFQLAEGEKVACLIALGYGETQGVAHKGKTAEEVSNIAELGSDCPEWFKAGVEAALLAPTAVNQQKFHFDYLGDGKVSASRSFSMVGFSWIDLGIAKLHFEKAAGAENFKFVEN